MPIMHLIAGPNGAGKSLLYECLIRPRHPALPFVSAQAYAIEYLQGVTDAKKRADKARAWTDEAREELLRDGKSFVTESVFSHSSRVALITHARALGFEVVLYALALDEPRKLVQRVNQQAREGGDPAPTYKVLDRYPKTLENLHRGIRAADVSFLFDAVDASQGGPRLVATVNSGKIRLHAVPRPLWLDRVLGLPGTGAPDTQR
jgi:predicted ABC-type ATPase